MTNLEALAETYTAQANQLGAQVAAATGVRFIEARLYQATEDYEGDSTAFLTFDTDKLDDAAYETFAQWLANVPGFVELDDDTAEVALS